MLAFAVLGACTSGLVHCTDAIAELARSLTDHKLTLNEVPGARAVLTRLSAKIRQLEDLLDEIEMSAMRSGNGASA